MTFLHILVLFLTYGLITSDPTDLVEDVAFIKIGDYSKKMKI